MSSLYVMTVAEILLLIISLMKSRKDILKPSSTYVIVFTFSSVIASFYVHNWTQIKVYHWECAAIIISGTVIVLIVDLTVESYYKKHKYSYYDCGKDILYVPKWKMITVISIDVIILLFVYHYIKSIASVYGTGDGSIASIYRDVYGHSNIVSAENQMSSILRYGIYFMQASAYVYLYPVVNNILIKKKKITQNIIYAIPALIFILYGIFCGSRADILKITISGFIMFYILFMKNNGWNCNNTKKIIKMGVKIIAIILPLFFFLSVIVGRSAYSDSLINSLILQIAGYAGAPIVHFSQYLDNPVATITPGEETFNGLFLFLKNHGFSKINSVKHLEYNRLRGGIYGNVYTSYRRPLHDFGIIGMFMFLISFAVLVSVIYYKKIKMPHYRKKDKFGIWIIVYSILFQWVAYASIDQIGGEFISISFLIRIIMIIAIYMFSFCFYKSKIKFI